MSTIKFGKSRGLHLTGTNENDGKLGVFAKFVIAVLTITGVVPVIPRVVI